MAPPDLPNGLPDVQRLITSHNAEGKAVFSNNISPTAVWTASMPGANFFLAYTTKAFPVDINAEPGKDSVPRDIVAYEKNLQEPPAGLSAADGTVLRFVDFAPSQDAYMHRTESLDYGVVLEGTLVLILDSGEVKSMRRGDVCVQRATRHAWKNTTESEGWARMMFVLVSSEKVVVGGQPLGTDLPGVLGEHSDVEAKD